MRYSTCLFTVSCLMILIRVSQRDQTKGLTKKMLKYIKLIPILSLLILFSCTNSGEMYDKKKHTKKDLSKLNSAIAIIGGAILLNEAAKAGAFSGYGSDTDWDWDYLPGSNQWRCRGIQTGQFAPNEKCAYDYKDDDRWSGN